jgi:hypothetical protein
MIDIIFDHNDNNVFHNKEYDIEIISESIPDTYDEYRRFAKYILHKHQNEENIIIKIINESVLLNKLALAMFIESADDDKINCIVFKVKDLNKSIEQYKPYIALTIGVKYALRLIKEDIKTIYKDMETLNYLGLIINHDYLNNIVTFKLENSSNPIQTIKTENITDAITWVAVLKALSLAEIEVSIEVLCPYTNHEQPVFDREKIIEAIINNVSAWIK